MALGTTTPGSWIAGAVNGAMNTQQQPQPQQQQTSAGGGVGGAVANNVYGPPSAPVYGPPSMPGPATPTLPDPAMNPGPWKPGYTTQNSAAEATARQYAQQGFDYSNAIHGGDMADLLMQQHLAKVAGRQNPQRYQLGQNELYNAYNSNMARNQLGLRGVDIDRQGVDISRGMLGIDRQGLGVSRDYISNMSGLADRALEETLSGINRNLATDQRNTTSDYTARGAYFAPFHRMDLADNYANALQARTEASQQREGQQYGWDRDLANLGLEDQRINLRYQDLGLADQRLNLEAERLGIDANDYQNALQQGLAQMGLDQEVNVQELLALAVTGDAQQAALFTQILQDAFMYSDFFQQNPELAAQILGSVYANQP